MWEPHAGSGGPSLILAGAPGPGDGVESARLPGPAATASAHQGATEVPRSSAWWALDVPGRDLTITTDATSGASGLGPAADDLPDEVAHFDRGVAHRPGRPIE